MTLSTTRNARPALRKRKLADRGTREQLLEIAGQFFAEKGFDRATSKEICRRARANPAAARAAVSIMSPCFMLLVADRRTISRAFPNFAFGPEAADALVAHLVRFALAGLSAAAAAARKDADGS